MQIDPPDGSGYRGYKVGKVQFGRCRSGGPSYHSAFHKENMSAEVSVSTSLSGCGAEGGGITAAGAYGGLVIQSVPNPLGVPALGDNEFVWSSDTPARLDIPACAAIYTWGWTPMDSAWLAEEISFQSRPEIPTEDTKPGIRTSEGLCAQSLVDERYENGLVYKSKYLPPKNSDFGKKEVLLVSRQGEVDYAGWKCFIPPLLQIIQREVRWDGFTYLNLTNTLVAQVIIHQLQHQTGFTTIGRLVVAQKELSMYLLLGLGIVHLVVMVQPPGCVIACL